MAIHRPVGRRRAALPLPALACYPHTTQHVSTCMSSLRVHTACGQSVTDRRHVRETAIRRLYRAIQNPFTLGRPARLRPPSRAHYAHHAMFLHAWALSLCIQLARKDSESAGKWINGHMAYRRSRMGKRAIGRTARLRLLSPANLSLRTMFPHVFALFLCIQHACNAPVIAGNGHTAPISRHTKSYNTWLTGTAQAALSTELLTPHHVPTCRSSLAVHTACVESCTGR